MTTHYSVAPRFTPGSPALVDEATALRVAEQERSMVAEFPDDAQGGLEGIAYAYGEHGKYIHLRDLLTDRLFKIPVKEWTGGHWHSRTDRDKYLLREGQPFSAKVRA